MQIRLTADDMALVRSLRRHYAARRPVPIDITAPTVVRMGLVALCEAEGIGTQPNEPTQSETDDDPNE